VTGSLKIKREVLEKIIVPKTCHSSIDEYFEQGEERFSGLSRNFSARDLEDAVDLTIEKIEGLLLKEIEGEIQKAKEKEREYGKLVTDIEIGVYQNCINKIKGLLRG